MRSALVGSRVASRYRDPRTVIGIIYPTGSIYVTNRPGIANVPGNVVHGVLTDISTTSQSLQPDEARATIGTLSFTVLDLAGAVTDELRDQLLNFDAGVRLREVRVFTGDDDDFTLLERVETYVVDSVVELDGRSYRFKCSDRSREQRTDIFEQATTRLDASLTDVATTVTVQSTDGFNMVAHTASFTDAPSATVGYFRIKKTGEVIRYTGKTATTFTGCTRERFGTRAQAVTIEAGTDADRRPEIEEVIYLELPMPEMFYALQTGVILSSAATLPATWHMGISQSFVNANLVQQIGVDLYNPSDVTEGFILRFLYLSKTDGKRFLEEQVLFPGGCFAPIDSNGVIGLRRVAPLVSTAQPSAVLFDANVIRHGSVQHVQNRVINQLIVYWNFDGEQYTRINVFTNPASRAIHQKAKPKTIKLRGLHVSRHSVATLRRIFASITDRYGAPPIEVSAKLSRALNRLEIGDTVRMVLARVRDYTALAHLDRSFEIQRRQINWRTGDLSVELFGSTARTVALGEDGSGAAGGILADAWYSSIGTALSSVLTISANAVTANGNLPAGTYYHLGNLTIAAGVTVTINGTVRLHIRGALTINGVIDGVGRGVAAIADPNTVGATQTTPAGLQYQRQTVGTTRGSSGVLYFPTQGIFRGNLPTSIQLTGQPALARFAIDVDAAGALVGEPTDLAGTPGVYGGPVVEHNTAAGTVRAKGGAGGGSGAGLVIVTRGALSFGASGEIDLSGGAGASPASTVTLAGKQLYAGAGGGGAPGGFVYIADGLDIPRPDLSTTFTADHGATPALGNPITLIPPETEPAQPWTGTDAGIGTADRWEASHFIQYVPSPVELGESDDEVTPPPTNLAAAADGTGVRLTWTAPPPDRFDFVEVWESINNDRANATLLGRIYGSTLFRGSDASITRYYWVRARDDRTGPSAWEPVSATGGVSATFGGATGPPGADAVEVSVSPQFAQWVQAPNGGAFTPSGTTCDVTFTFKRGGSAIATHVIRVTRSGTTLTAATFSESGEATAETSVGSGTSVLTVLVQHTASGVTGAQAISVVEGGDDGAAGAPGADGDDGLPGSNALNEDPSFRDISLAAGHWQQTNGNDLAAVASTPTVTNGVVGRRVLRFNVASNVQWWSEEIPLDASRNYQVSVWARQVSATPINYLLVAFFDANGVNIDSGGSDATGWDGIGTFHYWARLGQPFATSLTYYSKNFGPNSTAKIPTGAVSCRIGSLTNYSNAAAENIDFQDFRLVRLISLTDQIYGQLQAAFAAAGLINANISINADGSLTGAGGGAPVISSLSGSVATGQLTANVLAALQAVIGNLAAIKADIGSITAGNITFNSTGAFIKLGTAGYSSGIGFYVEYNGGTPRLFLGDAGGSYMRWTGSELEIVGDITANYSKADWGATQTFSPSWSGFSPNGSPQLSYAVSVDGRWAKLWCATELSQGANPGNISFSNLPAAIRPPGTSFAWSQGTGIGFSNTSGRDFPFALKIWQASHASAGTVEFAPLTQDGTVSNVSYEVAGAWGPGTAGIRAGMVFEWPIA